MRNRIIKYSNVALTLTITWLHIGADDIDPEIDKVHIENVPNCGKMSKTVSSRMTNTGEAKVHYPWVIRVIRYWNDIKVGGCGGTILTKRLG